MRKYKVIKLNRLYKGLASVRDYIWEQCVREGMGIEFVCNDARMFVEPWELRSAKPGKNVFTSKYDKKQYKLVDFKWKPRGRGLYG